MSEKNQDGTKQTKSRQCIFSPLAIFQIMARLEKDLWDYIQWIWRSWTAANECFVESVWRVLQETQVSGYYVEWAASFLDRTEKPSWLLSPRLPESRWKDTSQKMIHATCPPASAAHHDPGVHLGTSGTVPDKGVNRNHLLGAQKHGLL